MKHRMKQTLSLLLSIVMALSVFGGLRLPAFALDEVLEIRTVDDWNRFAGSYETDSGIYQRKTVRLLADVGPVTTRFWGEFNGTFDGGGHTLTVNIGNGGLFSSIGGGAVKNLTVAGAFSSLGGDEGALVTTVIINSDCVISNVRITADVSSSGGAVAGFVGWCEEYSRLVIENSAFEGGLFGNTAAGFVNFCTGSSVTIKNSVFSGYCENAKNFSTVGYTDGDGYASSATIQNVRTNTPDVYGGLDWWRIPLYSTTLPTDAGYSPAAAQSLINRIGDVAYTAECKAKIDKARAVYDTLTADEKQQVTNAAVLTAAEEAYAALEAEANQAAADEVEALIAAIGTVEPTFACHARVAAARAAFNALSADQQALVTNYSALTDAETALAPYRFGQCGENVFYVWDTAAGEVTVSGTGNMYDYSDARRSPFLGSGNVKSVVFEDGVTSVGARMFYTCGALQSVTIPNSVTSVGDYAFAGCGALESVTIPGSVRSIGCSAFVFCNGLQSVTISYGVTSIGRSAFSGCEKLKSVTLPNSVTSIGESAFIYCLGLEEIALSTGLTRIEKETFYRCAALKEITIPSGVTTVADLAFQMCYVLESVTFPESLRTIGDGAFSYCRKLESVTIPEGVTTIGAYAFKYCDAATSVTIPKSVTSIGGLAFENCDALQTVYYNGTEAEWDALPKGEYYLGFYSDNTNSDRDREPEEMPAFVFCAGLKAAAKAELAAYKNADDYRADEQSALAAAISAGNDAIDAAADTDAVDAALADAKAAIDAIKTDAELTVEELAADTAAADAVEAKIDAIGEVAFTDASKAKIDEARAAYDALTPAQQALVENADVLTAAEARYAELKAEAQMPEEPVQRKECPICGKLHNHGLFDALLGEIHWWIYTVKRIITSFAKSFTNDSIC